MTDRLAELLAQAGESRDNEYAAMNNVVSGNTTNNSKKTGGRRNRDAFDDEQDDNDEQTTNGSVELNALMAKHEKIKTGLDTIRSMTQAIDDMRVKSKTAANEKTRKAVMSEVDQLMTRVSRSAIELKNMLDAIKNENRDIITNNPSSAKTQMRINLYQRDIKRMHTIMGEYNRTVDSFKKELQNRTKREIRIVDSSLSDDQVEEIVESGRATEVIRGALLSDHTRAVVSDIESRHLDIMKLEQQVLEVFQLFKDLSVLVDLQQESLDVIENRISNSERSVGSGYDSLVDAEDYLGRVRRRKCCLLIIGLAIIVAILAPVLYTTYHKS